MGRDRTMKQTNHNHDLLLDGGEYLYNMFCRALYLINTDTGMGRYLTYQMNTTNRFVDTPHIQIQRVLLSWQIEKLGYIKEKCRSLYTQLKFAPFNKNLAIIKIA